MSLLPSAPRRAFATDAPACTAGVTAETTAFVTATRYEDLPPELIALGKQHILDAFDLAIAGEKAESSPTMRRYLADLGGLNGPPTVLSTNLQAASRFAALAIHADDFDDNRREARMLRRLCRVQRVKSMTRRARAAALLGRPIALPPSAGERGSPDHSPSHAMLTDAKFPIHSGGEALFPFGMSPKSSQCTPGYRANR